MRVIFVPVADRPECAKALRTAFDLGRQLGANLYGCHIRAHSRSDVALPSDLGSLADFDAAWETAWKGKRTQKSSARVKALFGKVAERHDYELIKKPRTAPGAVWLEKVGSPNKVLAIMGPVSDLIVVSRPLAKGGKACTHVHVSCTAELCPACIGITAIGHSDDRQAHQYCVEPKCGGGTSYRGGHAALTCRRSG